MGIFAAITQSFVSNFFTMIYLKLLCLLLEIMSTGDTIIRLIFRDISSLAILFSFVLFLKLLITLKTISIFVHLHVPTHSHSNKFNSKILSKEKMQEADFYSIRWFMIGEADISIQQFLPFSTPCILVLPNVRNKDKF